MPANLPSEEQRVHISLEQPTAAIRLLAGVNTQVIAHRPTVHVVDRGYCRCDLDSAPLVPAPWTESRHPLAALVHAAAMLHDANDDRLLNRNARSAIHRTVGGPRRALPDGGRPAEWPPSTK